MNWTERELDLFKSKRQRGTKPPPAPEFSLHCLIADVLKRWCAPDWRYTHLPMGEFRTPATAGRLKRMGVTAGWPDFMFLHKAGRVCFLELKRRYSRLSEDQRELEKFFSGTFPYCCTSSFDEALRVLKMWGIVPSAITAWGTGSEQQPSARDASPCTATRGPAIE